MSVTITSRTALTTADNAADFLVIDDTDAGITKKITPDNLRNSMLAGSALTGIDDTTLTADRALVSSGAGLVAAASVTSTELGYVSGVTSAIQTQLNTKAATSTIPPNKNFIHNGNMDVFSYGTSTALGVGADDTYVAPHINALQSAVDSGGVTVTQETTSPPTGSRYYLRMAETTTTDAAACGIVFFLEAKDAIPLYGQTVSLSFKCKTSSAANVFSSILSWSSTADAITSDVVSSWADEATTFVANWTREGGLGTHNTTTSWATYSNAGVAIDTASTANIAVFIWVNLDASATCDITQVKLEISATATTFIPKPIEAEMAACQRVHLRLAGDASANGPNINAYGAAGSDTPKQWFAFPTTMRSTPVGSVNGTWATTNCSGPTLDDITEYGASMVATATGAGMCIITPNGTDDYLDFDAGL